MICRCTSPNRPTWKHYGGRGITVCDRWRKFENFLADMGPRPEGRSLDRIDVHGHYEPGNCRWATPTEQARNSTQSKLIEIGGESRRLLDWCEVYQISVNTVRARVKQHGWPLERAITTPPKRSP